MTLEKASFATGDLVVYPSHGVGRITGIETQEIAGLTLSVFVVLFDKDRMTLRVPLAKAKVSGLRRLSSRKEMDAALAKLRGRSRAKRTMWSRRAQEYQAKIASGDPGSIAEVVRDLYRNTGQPEQSYSERQIYQAALAKLRGKTRAKRTMWSRRAQEYEAKINSGDPASIAEVVRDLYRNAGQADQSYSERQIFQAAMDRLVREFAAVEKIDEATATKKLEELLQAA